ncbi:hypothetical protein BDZ45DRAFT_750638 [Acephala macrosclerotiorum]|nr:hypothetical protein BDZ45DRAFT_750638 [Acephala macrosclerotiorum]
MSDLNRSPKRPKVSHEPSTGAPNSNSISFDRPDFSEPSIMVAFFVTENGKTEKLVVHREHACYYSPVFKAAFNSIGARFSPHGAPRGRAARGSLSSMSFGKESLNLLLLKKEVDERVEGNWPLMDAEQQNLFELWILAGGFCIPRLQNKVVDYYRFAVEDCKRTLSPASFHFVYDNTKADSILRNLIVILTAAYLGVASFKRRSDMYPRQMLVDIIALMLGRSGEEIDDGLFVLLEDTCYVNIPDGQLMLIRYIIIEEAYILA